MVETDDGVRLVARTEGPDDAPTIVLVHGYAATMAEYDSLAALLAERCRVVRFDLRGHGGSDRGDLRAATLRRLARDLATVVDELVDPGSPLVLVGHSLGGMAVLELVRADPRWFDDRVDAVALLSTAALPLAGPVGRLPGVGRLARSGAGRWIRVLARAGAPLWDRLRPFRLGLGWRPVLHRLLSAPGHFPSVGRLVRRWFTGTPTSVQLAFLPSCVLVDQSDALPRLAGVPTLVLTGADDRSIASRHSERLARLLGGRARLVSVPGAGHMVDLTHPEAVGRALDDLLARVRPR